MNTSGELGAVPWNHWRLLRWGVALALLATPAVMMQVSDEWNWGVFDFVFAAVMIGGVALLYDVAERLSGNRVYRAGAAVALLSCFMTIWAMIVRDDGTGIGYIMIVLAVGMGSFAAWFRPAGMARAMLGVAAMQVLLGALIATAPLNADAPGGPFWVVKFNAFFTVMWLVAAALFGVAARAGREN